MSEETAIAVREYSGLTMHCSPAEALRRVQELQAFVESVMVRDTDYGVIPGTGSKPSLYQPGAQKLCEIYGLAPDYLDLTVTEDWSAPFFYYRTKCVLTDRRSGLAVGSGVGACSSREDRYAYRWVKAEGVPRGTDLAGLKSKSTQYGVRYRLPNDDVASLVNTIQKMACKRALVHAVLGVTRSSGMFTQDVEDLPAEAFGEAAGARSWEHAARADVARVVEGQVVSAAPAAPAPALAVDEVARWTVLIKSQTDATWFADRAKIREAFGGNVPKSLAALWLARQAELAPKREPGADDEDVIS